MDLTILNQDFEMVYILDVYESLLWVDKFSEPGTFEIYTPVTDDILTYVKPDYYIQQPNSEHTMIIEDISIESNIENGNKIKIVGRSIESILDRRIVWSQTNLDGSLQTGIKKLIDDAIINPSNTYRKISNFEFKTSSDTAITSLTMEHQYTGDSLLDVVTSLCDEADIGFKIILNDEFKFIFELYYGTDRSYKQDLVPYVVFSPNYDNIISSNYLEKNSIVKNIALVAGEGEGTSRKTVGVGSGVGISRKEVYIDASSIRQESLSNSKYTAKLKSFGKDKLTEINKERKSFDGQCETTQLYSYGRDFFMGDIVQITNEYGIKSSSRIVEFTWSVSSQGIETYPTFVERDDIEDEEGGTS